MSGITTRNMDREEGCTSCAKCHASPAPHLIRKDELCRNCFAHWVGVKVSKQLGIFYVGRDRIKKHVLLSISFGYCSLALLAILENHLERQMKKTHCVGYELYVLHILGADPQEPPSSAIAKLSKLEKRFPNYRFSSVSLEVGVARHESGDQNATNNSISQERLQNLSSSSHEDMMLVVRDRLILKHARDQRCTHIIYGDTTSKLSERILSETAKGRGFSLPQLIGNAIPPSGVSHIYPLRDLFRSEMEEYAKHIQPDIWEFVGGPEAKLPAESRIASARNMTINKLMAQYVTEMEGNSPSIVTNVLRTSSKLIQPSRSISCEVCGMAMDESTSGLRGWGGDQAIDLGQSGQPQCDRHSNAQICYGCARSFQCN